jgi:DsbC/DsbD-like thiol-disulfide interchange protein
VCKDICMPVEAELNLDLDMPVRKADRETLLHTLEQVPRKQQVGADCPHRFLSAAIVSRDEMPALRVETEYEASVGRHDLMVETHQDVGLAAPTQEAAASPGRAIYVIALEPETVPLIREKPLTFTTVSDRGSCETISSVK